MLAALYNIRTEGKKKVEQRLLFKLKLAKLCFQRGYNKLEIQELLWFVEYSIALPPQEETVYEEQFNLFLKRKKMPYIDEFSPSSIRNMERFIYGRTLAERDAEIKKQNILRLHQQGIEPTIIAKVWNIDLSVILSIIEQNKKLNN